jgi:hypothetical protein
MVRRSATHEAGTAIALVSPCAVDAAQHGARWIADLIPVRTGEVESGPADIGSTEIATGIASAAQPSTDAGIKSQKAHAELIRMSDQVQAVAGRLQV